MEASAMAAYLAEHGERLGLFTGPDFLALPLPERVPILGPWLVEQSLTMLYAERGLGKSMLLMAMGLAVAKGEGFLGYPAGPAERVLMVDAEMPPREGQKRLAMLAGGMAPPNFMYVSVPQAAEDWADLNDPYGRMQLDEIIRYTRPKVLILDNKSTLMPPDRENDAESWVDLQRWFGALRKAGLAVVLVHHSGKGGQQRGTSMVEVTLDTVIKLSRAPSRGPAPPDGARFVLSFEKNRHFYGPDAAPKLIELLNREGQPVWQVQAVSAEQVEERETQVRLLAGQGISQREIAAKLGIGLGTVNRALQT